MLHARARASNACRSATPPCHSITSACNLNGLKVSAQCGPRWPTLASRNARRRPRQRFKKSYITCKLFAACRCLSRPFAERPWTCAGTQDRQQRIHAHNEKSGPAAVEHDHLQPSTHTHAHSSHAAAPCSRDFRESDGDSSNFSLSGISSGSWRRRTAAMASISHRHLRRLSRSLSRSLSR
jgi:hypothetical protein